MRVIFIYEVPDNDYEKLANMDLPGEDVLDAINDHARYLDEVLGIWHLPDSSDEEINEAILNVFNKFSAPKTKEIIDG